MQAEQPVDHDRDGGARRQTEEAVVQVTNGSIGMSILGDALLPSVEPIESDDALLVDGVCGQALAQQVAEWGVRASGGVEQFKRPEQVRPRVIQCHHDFLRLGDPRMPFEPVSALVGCGGGFEALPEFHPVGL